MRGPTGTVEVHVSQQLSNHDRLTKRPSISPGFSSGLDQKTLTTVGVRLTHVVNKRNPRFGEIRPRQILTTLSFRVIGRHAPRPTPENSKGSVVTTQSRPVVEMFPVPLTKPIFLKGNQTHTFRLPLNFRPHVDIQHAFAQRDHASGKNDQPFGHKSFTRTASLEAILDGDPSLLIQNGLLEHGAVGVCTTPNLKHPLVGVQKNHNLLKAIPAVTTFQQVRPIRTSQPSLPFPRKP